MTIRFQCRCGTIRLLPASRMARYRTCGARRCRRPYVPAPFWPTARGWAV